MTDKAKEAVNGYLSPRTLQIAGLILLLVSAGFWMYTGKESALLVGASLTLIGVGSYGAAVKEFKQVVTNGGKGGGAHERSSESGA